MTKSNKKTNRRAPRNRKPLRNKRFNSEKSRQVKVQKSPFISGIRDLGNAIMPGLGSVGSSVYSTAKNFISKITGSGDYKVNNNSVLSGAIPLFDATNREVFIRHKEMIAVVNGGSSFNLRNFLVSPNNPNIFPWLSGIANNFQEYEFTGIVFAYKSTSGHAISSANAALGNVCIATQYNVYDKAFATIQDMKSYEFSTICNPSEDMLHPIECDASERVQKSMFMPSGQTSSIGMLNEDYRFTTPCRVYLATTGQQSGYTIGELWVTYDIILRKPRKSSITAEPSMHAKMDTVSTSNYFGATRTLVSGFQGVTFSSTSITFPINYYGHFVLSWSMSGGSVTTVSPTIIATGNASSSTIYAGNTSSALSSGGLVGGFMVIDYAFRLLGGGTITFSGGTLPSSTSSADLYIFVVTPDVSLDNVDEDYDF